jgi:osmotically-inducible protein OsmY
MRLRNLHSAAIVTMATSLILPGGFALKASDLDSRIEASAKASYNFKTYLKDDSIKVQSAKGVVTLSGTVSQDYHKSLAQETVAGLPGVKSVNNGLTVVGDQPAEPSDAWISLKVKAALAFHKNVKATDTNVQTEDGVVTLTGPADSEANKELAGEYAKDVEGVKTVRNQLVVPTDAPAAQPLAEKVDDASITAQVKTALLFHRSTHALATKVATTKGVVTLRGEAVNEAEKDLVTKLAEDIHGVKRVHNQMSVQKS